MSIVIAQHVSKAFGKGASCVHALRSVDLRVAQGEFLAIVGPSGSGKSTLLHILGGVETPTAGRVLLEDRDIWQMADDERTILRRRRIGFVFQRINLLQNLTSKENVIVPMLVDGVPRAQRERRAEAMIDLVGMSTRRDAFPPTLSGGEQQRVAIARALAMNPAIILADEPTGSLDRAGGAQITRLLRELAGQMRQTVVVVTHDVEVASQADRRVHMCDGRLEAEPGEDPLRYEGADAASEVP